MHHLKLLSACRQRGPMALQKSDLWLKVTNILVPFSLFLNSYKVQQDINPKLSTLIKLLIENGLGLYARCLQIILGSN